MHSHEIECPPVNKHIQRFVTRAASMIKADLGPPRKANSTENALDQRNHEARCYRT